MKLSMLQKRLLANSISECVKILELFELNYEVTKPKRKRKPKNKCPRVIYTKVNNDNFSIYSGLRGSVWVAINGKPTSIKSPEQLYSFLKDYYD